jgi:hypothetical protein
VINGSQGQLIRQQIIALALTLETKSLQNQPKVKHSVTTFKYK